MSIKPFPHYQQQELADCGPSCLRMIARHYGKEYSAEMLRKRCFISREGVSMLGISDAAESIEADMYGRKMVLKMVRIMEDRETGKKSALFQSETSMEIIREQKTKGRLNTGKGVLHDNLVKMIRDVLHP